VTRDPVPVHRELIRRKWTFRRKGWPGRPPLEPGTIELILQLARENPPVGYQRIPWGPKDVIAPESETSARSATMPRHDPVPPLPCPTPGPRPGALRPALGSRGGARERGPASPGRHPAPASQASRVPDLGQGVPHRREQAAPARGVGVVPGPTRRSCDGTASSSPGSGLGRIAPRDALPSTPRFANSFSD
jgi:hypothetical protein